MARVSTIRNALNGGELSPLMEGRIDYDRFGSSQRRMTNKIGVPQGPAIDRPGTTLIVPTKDETVTSHLRTFGFSDDQALQLEFGENTLRFHSDSGVLVYDAVSVTAVAASSNLTLTMPGHVLGAGDQIILSGFPANSGLTGAQATVVSVVGNDIVVGWPNSLEVSGLTWVSGMAAALVYTIATPWAADDLSTLRLLQSADTCYCYCDGYRPRTLTRFGTYDWRIAERAYNDGPFLSINETATRLTPSGKGNVPTAGANGTAFTSGTGTGQLNIFDGGTASGYWEGGANQTDYVGFQFNSAAVVKTYTLYPELASASEDYAALDYAPSTWTFEASNNGSTWTVLDTVRGYVLWDYSKSVAFKTNNDTAYTYYRLNVTACKRNGLVKPRLKRMVFGPDAPKDITITASDTTGINSDAGFAETDVGRLIRILSGDDVWRSLVITQYVSTTEVVAQLQDFEPLYDTVGTIEWRLGLFSDTTGWPICGHFFSDRIWEAGAQLYPDTFVASIVGSYGKFAPTTGGGEVLDDSGFKGTLNARKLSRITWINSDERGLLLGTGAVEWVVTAATRDSVLTARNVQARDSTARGAQQGIEPVKVDRQILFVQRGQRTLREFAYSFNSDGYKSPSLSQLASHIGAQRFAQIEYAQEPYSIVWVRRLDGSLASLVYNRDENVVGWQTHDLAGGFVESMSVMPDTASLQDALWLIVRRTINGRTRRFVEKMTPMWDFGMTLTDAHLVDCGLRYEGAATNTVYGLGHLEGEEVVGLADGAIFPAKTVTNGSITLDAEASNIVVGLGYESIGETSRIEAGSQTGTAQGKPKKFSRYIARVWDTGSGQLGVPAAASQERAGFPAEDEFVDVIEREPSSIGPDPLFTGDCTIKGLPPSYDGLGTIVFRRPAAYPLPFNLVAIIALLDTEDQ